VLQIKTTVQLNAEFFNALINDATLQTLIGDRVRWLSTPTISDTFPLMTYAKFDNAGQYAFGINLSAENVTFETRHYVDPQDGDASGKMSDKIMDALKVALNAINYRQINAPAVFLEANINKAVSIVRWERVNAD